jgi:hypothetical protein
MAESNTMKEYVMKPTATNHLDDIVIRERHQHWLTAMFLVCLALATLIAIAAL